VAFSHERRVGEPRPRRFQAVELHLHDHHADRPRGTLEAAGEIEARQVRDRAQGEVFRSAARHRLAEIGTEAVALADEAARRARVAGRDGQAVGCDHIDGRGVGPRRQQLELAVEDRQARRAARLDRRQHIGIGRQDDGDGAVLVELGLQHGGPQRRLAARIAGRGLERLFPRPVADQDRRHGQGGEGDGEEDQPWNPAGEEARHVSSRTHRCGLSHAHSRG
jgi:hypothetical protein